MPILILIARAIAEAADGVGETHVAVLDEYICQHSVENCLERPNHIGASRLDATGSLTAFAEAKGIRVDHWSGSAPACGVGMFAEFMQPEVHGDSARVEMWNGCTDADGVGRGSIWEFTLRAEGGRWAVTRERRVGGS